MYVTCCVAPKRIVRIERVKAFVFILLKIVYFRYKKKKNSQMCMYIYTRPSTTIINNINHAMVQYAERRSSFLKDTPMIVEKVKAPIYKIQSTSSE